MIQMASEEEINYIDRKVLKIEAYVLKGGLPGGSVGKNPPAKQEKRVQSLGQEDPLEKEMTTHSSILAWEIPWTEKPGGLQFMGSQELDRT